MGTLAVFTTLFSLDVFALHRAKLSRVPLQPFDPSQAAIKLAQKYGGVGVGSSTTIAKLTKELVSQTELDSEVGADVILAEGNSSFLRLASKSQMMQGACSGLLKCYSHQTMQIPNTSLIFRLERPHKMYVSFSILMSQGLILFGPVFSHNGYGVSQSNMSCFIPLRHIFQIRKSLGPEQILQFCVLHPSRPV